MGGCSSGLVAVNNNIDLKNIPMLMPRLDITIRVMHRGKRQLLDARKCSENRHFIRLRNKVREKQYESAKPNVYELLMKI